MHHQYPYPIWYLLENHAINKREADLLKTGFIPATLDEDETIPLIMGDFQIIDIVIG